MRPPSIGKNGSPNLARPNDTSLSRLPQVSRTLSRSEPSKRKSLAEFDITALQLESTDADMLALDSSSQSFLPRTRPDSLIPSVENFKNLQGQDLEPGQRLSLKQISPQQGKKRQTNLFTDSELDQMEGKPKQESTPQHRFSYYFVFFVLGVVLGCLITGFGFNCLD